MKHLLIVWVVLATSLLTNVAFAQKSAEAEVLNHYVGTWKADCVFKPSQWFPEGKRWVETNDFQWILDGHLQQMVTTKDGEETDLRIRRYNEKSKRYEMWSIHASDNSSYWVGSWDEDSKAMTWKFVDFGSGFTGKMVTQITGEGKGETSLIMQDVHGKALFDGQIQHTRTK